MNNNTLDLDLFKACFRAHELGEKSNVWCGQIANNNNNVCYNCLDGGMYVQSPKLMSI